MTKTSRRSIVFLLAIVIAATMALPASAQPESAENSMETALIAVKNLIDIDDDVYTDFSYSSSYSNYETMEGLLWSFYWSSSDGKQINARVTAEGDLLNYNKYAWDESRFGFATIDKNTAISIADEFIKKTNPKTYIYYKAPFEVNTQINSRQYSLNYNAEINGYSFDAAAINIDINKFTGEVTGYDASRIDPTGFTFEGVDGIISESAAIGAYSEKIGLSLEYTSYFNYDNGNIKAFPVYMRNSHDDRFISAKTGEIATYVYDLGQDDTRHMAKSLEMEAPEAMDQAANTSAYGSVKSSLTPGEIAAIDQAANFIGSEKALQKLLEATELTKLGDGYFNDKYIGLNKDYMDKTRYFYDINMYKQTNYDDPYDTITSLYGRVDAVTGRVTSFSFYYNDYTQSSQNTMSEAQAEAAVTAFLKKIAPSEFDKTKIENVSSPITLPYSYRGGNYIYSYVRYVNEIPFRNNSIDVTLNENTGKITSYYLNWYENVSFPSVDDVIPVQKALAENVAQNGSKIKYITIGEGKAALVYDFSGQAYIDPFSGKALDYTGEPSKDSADIPDYSDVKGHWSEKYVTKLLDNGVYMWGGKFEPDKVMTELEFLNYLTLTEAYDYIALTREDAKSYFSQRGVDVEASPDKLLTRQEAVRIIVEYLGYGKLAKQSKWYVYPFSDNVADSYKGYITICHMLGIVNGDASGKFNAAGNVTRAHAAVMLHNMIIAKS